jgi:hypothetical protein
MLPIPYCHIQLRSPLQPGDFTNRLATVTQPRYGWFRFPPEHIRFVGPIHEKCFRVVPVVRGTTTYAPWVRGHLREDSRGTLIDVTMTLHPVAVLFVQALLSLLQFWELAIARRWRGGHC